MQRLTLTITAAMATLMQKQQSQQRVVAVSKPAEDSKPASQLHYEISSIRRRL